MSRDDKRSIARKSPLAIYDSVAYAAITIATINVPPTIRRMISQSRERGTIRRDAL